MLNLTKNGIYSDITVIFNKTEYKLHILLLEKISDYFNCIYNNNFKDKKYIKINFNQIDGNLLDNKYFGIWIDSIYQDNFNISDTIYQSSIIEIIEFYRLLDYLKYNSIEKYNLKDILMKKLNEIKPIKNDMDEFMDEYKNMTVLKQVGLKCNRNCGYYVGIKCCNGCHGYNGILPKPSTIGLGTNFYKIDENLTYPYVEYLFKLINDENYKEKIIGISNIKLEDIYKFDTIYHKLIFKMLAYKI